MLLASLFGHGDGVVEQKSAAVGDKAYSFFNPTSPEEPGGGEGVGQQDPEVKATLAECFDSLRFICMGKGENSIEMWIGVKKWSDVGLAHRGDMCFGIFLAHIPQDWCRHYQVAQPVGHSNHKLHNFQWGQTCITAFMGSDVHNCITRRVMQLCTSDPILCILR